MPSLFENLAATSNLYRAFDRVEENHGCAGVDGQTIADFSLNLEANITSLRRQLLGGDYRPLPLLRVYVAKSSGGKRALSIPSVRDRIAQTAASQVLEPVLEPEFEDVSFGYRRGRSADLATRRIVALHQQGFQWVVDADIDNYFDEIPQDRIMHELERYVVEDRLLSVIRLWLSNQVQDGDLRFPLKRGIPQGSPLSPLLANLYLDRFDEAFLDVGARLVRFADDFVILCKSRPRAERALELSAEILKSLYLRLNPAKTSITCFNQGFRYLGVQFLRSLAFRPVLDQSSDEFRSALETPAATAAASAFPIAPKGARQLSSPFSGQSQRPGHDAAQALTPLGNKLQKALDSAGIQLPPADDSAEGPDGSSGFLPPTSGHDPVLRTLYVVEQGVEVGKEDERLVIRAEGKTLREIPALKVDQVILFGNIRLTTPAMQFCLLQDIPVFLLSSRGRYYGAIESASTDKVLLHRDQFSKAEDPAFLLDFARQVVTGKISNSRTLLMRSARRTPNELVRSATEHLNELLPRVAAATDVDQVRGFEGAAAAKYFSVWPAIIGEGWTFAGRVRNPPTDPVNSLLSFGYTILFYNAYALVRSRGLHPYAGFYHALKQGHAALVSDLIEEFRAPIVDSTVLTMLHRKQVRPEDFHVPESPGEPCLLSEQGRRSAVRAFEVALNRPVQHPDAAGYCDYRRSIALQAERLAATIRGNRASYEPFVTR